MSVYTQAVIVSTNDEGIQHSEDGPIHADNCPCRECKVYRLRMVERSEVYVERECEGDDCQGCPDCPDRRFVAESEPQIYKDMWLHRLAEAQIVMNVGPDWHDQYPDIVEEVYANWQYSNTPQPIPPLPLPAHLQRLSHNVTARLPAMLERDDGETVLYEGKLNTLVGEPAQGKTWVALIAAIASARRGARVVWWDFEDKPSTLAARLDALGAGDLVGSDTFVYAHPSLADDPDGISAVRAWASIGERAGMVVIDSAESAGCATDSNNVVPWYESMVNPWLEAGCGVLLLDHVPKRREERPRGGIGSQHKLARIDGAALFVSGQIWTKTEDGAVTLRLHKDRQGDLPAVLNKPVCTITGRHVDGVILYAITGPSGDVDDGDMGMRVLHAIAATGADGVKGMRKVRESTKGHNKAKDAALADLVGSGMVEVVKDGRANIYYATDLGIYTIEHDIG